ncbi:hypothetical protein PX52LOC_00756 [Limnoglobus roseus]|uniref:Uncharacterized protein n=1 Tax=Limnoglobus roseus TaxID=2598579 RepID=A0A5C1AA32_9BACT|nr:hypothetical protein PX52LOC_00756 [Limnoglobus roseus]
MGKMREVKAWALLILWLTLFALGWGLALVGLIVAGVACEFIREMRGGPAVGYLAVGFAALWSGIRLIKFTTSTRANGSGAVVNHSLYRRSS